MELQNKATVNYVAKLQDGTIKNISEESNYVSTKIVKLKKPQIKYINPKPQLYTNKSNNSWLNYAIFTLFIKKFIFF